MAAYAAAVPPSYASASASGRGQIAPSLDVTSALGGLAAFRAGPRRAPLDRQAHIEALSASARGLKKATSLTRNNTFGPAVQVPSQWPGSWDYDVEQHSQRSNLSPSRRPDGRVGGLLGSGAAGAAHEHLGLLGELNAGPPRNISAHFGNISAGLTEEETRLLLITNERARRHADKRWAPTDTLGNKPQWRRHPHQQPQQQQQQQQPNPTPYLQYAPQYEQQYEQQRRRMRMMLPPPPSSSSSHVRDTPRAHQLQQQQQHALPIMETPLPAATSTSLGGGALGLSTPWAPARPSLSAASSSSFSTAGATRPFGSVELAAGPPPPASRGATSSHASRREHSLLAVTWDEASDILNRVTM